MSVRLEQSKEHEQSESGGADDHLDANGKRLILFCRVTFDTNIRMT